MKRPVTVLLLLGTGLLISACASSDTQSAALDGAEPKSSINVFNGRTSELCYRLTDATDCNETREEQRMAEMRDATRRLQHDTNHPVAR